MTELDLQDVTLVGFSMGGGKVARYFTKDGPERIHRVVFASALPPYLQHGPGDSEGPLEAKQAASMTAGLTASEDRSTTTSPRSSSL